VRRIPAAGGFCVAIYTLEPCAPILPSLEINCAKYRMLERYDHYALTSI
jgi:hypothetical protein